MIQMKAWVRVEKRLLPLRSNVLLLVVRVPNQNHLLPNAGGWPEESDPRVRRNLTIFSARSTKQAIISPSCARSQLISFIDIIQSRFRDRKKRTAFQMNLDKLKSELESMSWCNNSITTTVDAAFHREKTWSNAFSVKR